MMITSQQTTLYQGKRSAATHSLLHAPSHSVSTPVIVISHNVAIHGPFRNCVALQRVWLNRLNIRREHLQQKLRICATRPCHKRSLFGWLACSREQEERVLLHKTSSPSFLGLSLVFTLVRFLHFTPENETCFVLLNHVSCHEKYKRNYHVTNCHIILNNTIHCFVIVITITRIPEINRDYLPTKLEVKQWVQILVYLIELTLQPPTSKLAE